MQMHLTYFPEDRAVDQECVSRSMNPTNRARGVYQIKSVMWQYVHRYAVTVL